MAWSKHCQIRFVTLDVGLESLVNLSCISNITYMLIETFYQNQKYLQQIVSNGRVGKYFEVASKLGQ